MIDVSELMSDPDFSSSYRIHRSAGKWIAGRFTMTKEETLNFFGPVQPADNDDLEQFPDGDRQKGLMKFFCAPPHEIYITMEDGAVNKEGEIISSDIIEYDNALYRIIRVAPWKRNGFVRAFGYKVGVVIGNG